MKRLTIYLLFLFCAACSTSRYDTRAEVHAEIERLSGYSDADVAAAEVDMDEKCGRYNAARAEGIRLMENTNAAMQKDIDNKITDSPEQRQAFEELKKHNAQFSYADIVKLDQFCKAATSKVGRMIDAQARAAKQLDQITNEHRSIHCISNQVGSNTYTSCN